MRGRSASPCSPTPSSSGAVTMLVVDRRGLPRLQRQQRPAVRADDVAEGRASPTAQNLVKGNEVRSGGFRVGVVEDMKPGPAVRRPGRRRARAQARQDDRRDPRGLALAHPPALGARPEVPRADRGRLEDGVHRRRHAPARADRGPTSTSTRSSTCSTRRRARPAQATSQGFGDAFAGRGADLGRTIEEAPRLLGHLEPVMRNLADPQHPAADVLQGARRRRAHRRAGLADATRACSRRWPTPSRRSAATPRRCRQFIAKQPADAGRRRSRRSASSARSWPTDRASPRTLGRDRASCAARCPTSTRRSRPAPASSAACPSSTRELAGHVRRARGPDLRAVDERRAARADRDGHHAQPAAALPTARSSRSATPRTTSAPTSPSTSPSPTRPARPSARCSTRTGRQDDSLGSMGADEPANGQRGHRGQPAVPARQPPTAPRSPPTGAPTARPASAATSSATPASTTRSSRSSRTRGRPARRARPTPGRAARARRARPSPRSPRPASTRQIPPSTSGER